MIFRTAALALAALASIAPAQAEQAPAAPENAKLAKLLDGREAGEPTNCIATRPNGRLYIIDRTALVYDAGRTVYVNYTRYPEALDANDIIVVRENIGPLCRNSRVEARSPNALHAFGGALFLTDFIPYERVAEQD